MARRKGSPLPNEMVDDEENVKDSVVKKSLVKGFNFDDERITNGNWVHEPNSDVIQKFLRLLAICHTAIPEEDEDTAK
uniref:hypothetical protein n=1 Tax=Salmonella sp. s51933 TaxID=3160127 RepID=UPI0037552ADD